MVQKVDIPASAKTRGANSPQKLEHVGRVSPVKNAVCILVRGLQTRVLGVVPPLNLSEKIAHVFGSEFLSPPHDLARSNIGKAGKVPWSSG